MTLIRLSPVARITPTDSGVVLRSDLGTFHLHGGDTRAFLEKMVPLLDGTRDRDGVAAELEEYSAASVLSFLELLDQKGLIESAGRGGAGSESSESSDRNGGELSEDHRRPQERFFHTWREKGARPAGLARGESFGEALANARVLLVGTEPWGAVAALELAAAGVGALTIVDGRTVNAEELPAVHAWVPGDVGRPRRDALADAVTRRAPGCLVERLELETAAPAAELLLEPDLAPDLLVCGLGADDLHLLLAAARWAEAEGVASLYGHLEGLEAWLGPAVLPREGNGKGERGRGDGCWNCFRLRRLGAAPIPDTAHAVDADLIAAPAPPRAHAHLGAMAAQAGHLLALEAIKLLTGYIPSTLRGGVLVQNLVTYEAERHGVRRMPWCEVCGGAASAPHRPYAGPPLASSRDVAELRERLGDLVSERTGVVRTLSSDGGNSVFPQLRTASATLSNYTEGTLTQLPLFQIGSGKGSTEVAAHLSAVGEALERYSAARYRLEDLRLASYEELDRELGGSAIDPSRLCLYSRSQYQEPGFPFPRFSPKRRIHWVRGRWLDDGSPAWVPALVAYFNFQTPAEDYFCQMSSNGLAAGTDPDDAALRALFELVERDALMLTWLAQLPARRLTPDDSLDPAAHEVLRQLAARGIEPELYLLDAGVRIPTVLCLGFGDGVAWPGAIASLACHPNPAEAARKAVLEQAHVAPYLAGLMPKARIPRRPQEVLTLEDHALYYVPRERRIAFDFLRVSGLGPPLPISAVPAVLADPATGSLAASCARLLADEGLRVAVVDVTSPDLVGTPFAAARAVGLDMQPIHFGLHLRRLGNPRLWAKLGPQGLHPHPHPIA